MPKPRWVACGFDLDDRRITINGVTYTVMRNVSGRCWHVYRNGSLLHTTATGEYTATLHTAKQWVLTHAAGASTPTTGT
jgi:hypothetical protein